MNKMTSDDFDLIEDDGEVKPIPALGKVKMSAGAKKLRKRFSGNDLEHIRAAKEMDAEVVSDRLYKVARLDDRAMVMLFAHLYVAGASEIETARIEKQIKERWPELDRNAIRAARDLAACEITSARQAADRKGQETNIADVHGFDELCNYGLTKLKTANAFVSQPTLFHYGSELARIPERQNGVQIEILNQKSFNHVLNTQAPYRRTQGSDVTISASAPRDVAEHLFCHSSLPVPVLERIVSVPTFTKEGRLVQTPGYDKASGLLYRPAPGFTMPPVPNTNLDAAAKKAAAYLVDLFADFPFDGCSREENLAAPGASLTNFLALLITPFVLPIFSDVIPAHLLTKPAPGTGATLLAECCQLVVDGKTDTRPPLTRNEDERRKALFSALQTQKNYLVYDNVAGEMDSGTIASFLTSREWTDRVLGRSGERTVTNSSAMVWTGINPGFTEELQRRISLIRLDAKMAKPSDRDGFKVKGDFKSHIRQNRGEIVAACVTLILNWIEQGMPKAKGKWLASFELWHATVGGVLEAAGFTKFQANRDELVDVTGADDDPMQALVQAWYDAANAATDPIGLETTVGGDAGLLALIQKHQISLPIRPMDPADEFSYPHKRVGQFLRKHKDSTYNVEAGSGEVAVSLLSGGRSGSGNRWSLVPRGAVKPAAPHKVAPIPAQHAPATKVEAEPVSKTVRELQGRRGNVANNVTPLSRAPTRAPEDVKAKWHMMTDDERRAYRAEYVAKQFG